MKCNSSSLINNSVVGKVRYIIGNRWVFFFLIFVSFIGIKFVFWKIIMIRSCDNKIIKIFGMFLSIIKILFYICCFDWDCCNIYIMRIYVISNDSKNVEININIVFK